MAAEHNLYFEAFCPKNTISCGAAARYSQYVGPLENVLLNDLKVRSRTSRSNPEPWWSSAGR